MLLHQGIWRKCIFAGAPSNLAWWCKVESPSASFSFFWSVSHDCAKISHGHAKLLFTIPLCVAANTHAVSFRMTMRKFRMVMRNREICFFRIFFAISLISSCLIHLHHLQLSSKSQSKLIALLLSLCIWIIINFIYFLQFD